MALWLTTPSPVGPGWAALTGPSTACDWRWRVPDIHGGGGHDGYCLLYRPPVGAAFCFEPVTHPIDAFHVPGRPGLHVLRTGESLTLHVQWRFHAIP